MASVFPGVSVTAAAVCVNVASIFRVGANLRVRQIQLAIESRPVWYRKTYTTVDIPSFIKVGDGDSDYPEIELEQVTVLVQQTFGY